MYLGKYFNEPFLQHILRIFAVGCKTVTHTQHFWAEPVIQLALSGSVVFVNSLQL